MSDKLTEKELDLLEEFLAATAELSKEVPPPLPPNIWDKVMPEARATGEVPEEYRDRIGINYIKERKHHFEGDCLIYDDGEQETMALYDIAENNWTRKANELQKKYHVVIEKSLRYFISQERKINGSKLSELLHVEDMLQELINQYGSGKGKKQLTSIIPIKHNMAVNKLANKITEPHKVTIGKKVALDVGKNCKRKTISTFILNYSGDIAINKNQPVSEYDMAIIQAAADLWDYGDESHTFTAATLFRAMVNATESETPSPTQIADLVEDLRRLSCTRITIDFSEELKKNNYTLDGCQVTGGNVNTALLEFREYEIEAGGHAVTAFEMISKPFIPTYAAAVKQIETVPAELLDIRDSTGAKVSNSKRRIAIKNYLMRHIIIMKRKNQSNNILYDKLLTSIDYEKEFSKRDRQLIRDYIHTVLDYWRVKHFIKSYSDIKKGRSITGINIQV